MTSPQFAANRDNYCYRHPDRQSFALCQRCLRTICGECQTPAPVGVICPECLVAAQQNAQQNAVSRPRRGLRMPRSRPVAVSDGRPLVTYTIIGIAAATFVLQLLLPAVEQWFAFYAPFLYPQTGVFQPWRLITGMFLHAGFWHFGLNMLALWMIGRILEPLLGHGRFLALYLISGVGGFVLAALLAFQTPVVGASGAIFGLLGALLVIGRHIGAEIRGILVVLGINLVIGFIPGFNVSWQAHVGGLVTGALVGFVFARTRRRQQRVLQIVLLAAITVGLLALLAVPLIV